MGTIYVGRYKVIEELGRGGMGVVYRGVDPVLERTVAIKVLPPKKMNSKSVERFLREAKTAARLDSPYIVKIHDIGQVDDIHFIVMEYVEGHSLSDMIEFEEVPAPEESDKRLKIFRQVLEAVQYAHENGVIHRDLKPDNIMINKAGNVKVMDFGLAFFSGQHNLTEVDQVMGTASYASPEQAAGKITDERTDIYSLGVILFELLTGRWPFDANTPLEMFRKVVEMPAPSPRIYNKDISPILETMILRCLRKKPEERYQSVSEMIESLDLYFSKGNSSVSASVGVVSAGIPGGSARPSRLPAPAPRQSADRSLSMIQSSLSASPGIGERESEGTEAPNTSSLPPRRLPAPTPSAKRILENTEESLQSPTIPRPVGVKVQPSYRSSGSIVVGGDKSASSGGYGRRRSAGVVTIGGEAAFRTSVGDYGRPAAAEDGVENRNQPQVSLPTPGPALRRAIEQTSVDVKAEAAPEPEKSQEAAHIPVPEFKPALNPEPKPESSSAEDLEAIKAPAPAPRARTFESSFKGKSKSPDTPPVPRAFTGNGPAVTSGSWMANVDEKELKPSGSAELDAIDIAALKREPESILQAGLAKLKSGKYQEAINEFNGLLEIDANNGLALAYIGSAQLELGELGAARSNIEKAVQALPEGAEPYIALADFFTRTGQPDLVISALHKALDRDEYNHDLRCRLAFLYFWQNRLEASVEQYGIVLEQMPEHFEANWSLGAVLAVQEHFEEALKYLDMACQINPRHTAVCNLFNYVCLKIGEIALAQQGVNRAIEAGCHIDADLQTCIGDIYIAQKMDNQALQELSEALKYEPGHIEASIKLSALFCHHGQLGEAVQILDGALKYHPNSIVLHRRLGEVYILGNKMEKALDHFEQLVKLDPSCSESYSRISKISLKKHYDVQNLDQYRRQVEAHPVTSSYREDLAMAYYCAGQYQQAINELVKACRLDYTNPDYPKSLGIMLLDLGAYEDAVRQLNVSLSMRPNDGQARGMLGRALAGQGLNNLAIIEYQKAIDSDIDMFLFNLPLARAYFLQGRQDQAVVCFKRFLATIPDTSNMFILYNALAGVGHSFAAADNLSAALEIFSSILQRSPYDYSACHGLAKIWLRKRNYGKASQYIDEAAQSAPYDVSLAVTKAEILGAEEHWQAAVAVLSKAAEIAPGSVKVIEQLGRAFRKCGRFQDAVDTFDRAAHDFPEYAPHFEWLKGRVQYRQGQYENAVWSYRRSIESDPGDWRVFVDLAKAYTSMQQLDEAAQAYRSAEDIAPAEEKKQIRSALNRLRR
ncbi:tetratricopeptide repeat protein [bacterium]|nr:tetratricopeptide repeat protein [bacterium]